MRDVDQTLGAGWDVGPAQIGNTVFGYYILKVVTQRSDSATWCERGNNFGNITFFGVGYAGNGNKSSSIFGIFDTANKIKLSTACGVLTSANTFSANLSC